MGQGHGPPIRLDGDYNRDEAEQARYLRELLDVFDAEGVDSAFVFTFASTRVPHRPEATLATTWTASYGIVKVLEGRPGADLPRHGMGAEGGVHRARRALRSLVRELIQQLRQQVDPGADGRRLALHARAAVAVDRKLGLQAAQLGQLGCSHLEQQAPDGRDVVGLDA